VLRALASFGIYPNLVPQAGASVSYNIFLCGAILLLLLSVRSSADPPIADGFFRSELRLLEWPVKITHAFLF
jgi:hypothetical protein